MRVVQLRDLRCIALAVCVAALAVVPAARAKPPDWVKPAAEATAKGWFGLRPVRLDAIELAHRVAVVATFPRIVKCGQCTGAPGTSAVRGRIFRFSFDRTTHSARYGNTLTIRRCRTRSSCYDDMPHTTLPDTSSWKAVARDLQDGRLDQPRSCGSLRALLAHLSKGLIGSPIYDMAAAACRDALGALGAGDPPATVRALLGAPDRRPGCWLYSWPATPASALVGARICFKDGRVSLVQRSVHG